MIGAVSCGAGGRGQSPSRRSPRRAAHVAATTWAEYKSTSRRDPHWPSLPGRPRSTSRTTSTPWTMLRGPCLSSRRAPRRASARRGGARCGRTSQRTSPAASFRNKAISVLDTACAASRGRRTPPRRRSRRCLRDFVGSRPRRRCCSASRPPAMPGPSDGAVRRRRVGSRACPPGRPAFRAGDRWKRELGLAEKILECTEGARSASEA